MNLFLLINLLFEIKDSFCFELVSDLKLVYTCFTVMKYCKMFNMYVHIISCPDQCRRNYKFCFLNNKRLSNFSFFMIYD